MMTSNFCFFFDFSFLNISHCQKQIDAIVFFIKYYEALNLDLQESNSSRKNRFQFGLHNQKNSKHDYFSTLCREVP